MNNNMNNNMNCLPSTHLNFAGLAEPVLWKKVLTDYIAEPGQKILADTSRGSFTISLPSHPATGASVMIADGENWAANPLTISRNGLTINGVASNLVVNTPNVQIEFIFDGDTWEVFGGTGASAPPVTPPSGSAISISNDVSSNSTFYPLFTNSTTGTLVSSKVSDAKLYFNPSAGSLTAVDFVFLSDKTLKENVTPISESLTKLAKVNPVQFTWKDNGKLANGVIAQEIEEIFPEIVSQEAESGIKSVSYIQLVPILVQAVKELSAELAYVKKIMSNK